MDTHLMDSCKEAHGEMVEFLTLQEAREDSLNSCYEKVRSKDWKKEHEFTFSFALVFPRLIHRPRHQNRMDLI